MKTLITAALLGLTAGTSVAYAETALQRSAKLKFDINGDGKIGRDEFVKEADYRFAQLDTNQDGFLTPDELRAGHGARHGGVGGPAGLIQDGAPPPPPGDGMRGPGGRGGRGGAMMRMDTDGDGKVTRAEYDAQGASRFARMDTNGDGVVDKTEMAALPGGGRMAGRIDADGSGTLTRAEFDAQSKQRFDRLDINGDGVIDAAELQAGPMGRGGRDGARRAPPAAAPAPPAPTGA